MRLLRRKLPAKATGIAVMNGKGPRAQLSRWITGSGPDRSSG